MKKALIAIGAGLVAFAAVYAAVLLAEITAEWVADTKWDTDMAAEIQAVENAIKAVHERQSVQAVLLSAAEDREAELNTEAAQVDGRKLDIESQLAAEKAAVSAQTMAEKASVRADLDSVSPETRAAMDSVKDLTPQCRKQLEAGWLEDDCYYERKKLIEEKQRLLHAQRMDHMAKIDKIDEQHKTRMAKIESGMAPELDALRRESATLLEARLEARIETLGAMTELEELGIQEIELNAELADLLEARKKGRRHPSNL